jgi:SAM domain (Sterile alpha motif)
MRSYGDVVTRHRYAKWRCNRRNAVSLADRARRACRQMKRGRGLRLLIVVGVCGLRSRAPRSRGDGDLGLGEHDATFRENAISEKVLPNLTAEDLKDMGIGTVGHRRMLLDAIAGLRTGPDTKAQTPSTTPLSTAPVAAASMPETAGGASANVLRSSGFDRNSVRALFRGMARSGRGVSQRRVTRLRTRFARSVDSMGLSPGASTKPS